MNRKIRIGVMGSGDCDPVTAETAERVGRGLAKNGAVLICGGGGGVMEAAARGASNAGGLVVGILPSDDEATANDWIELPIVTGMGNARNAINVLSSHVVIAIAGGPGTLSEIALAVKVGTPVVGLRTWDPAIQGRHFGRDQFLAVSSAQEAVETAVSLARQRFEAVNRS
jgi:uncharacterized protein (TIGR00725 family)